MDINFQAPLYLVAIIPAILLIIWWLKTQRRVKGKKRFAIAAIRLLLFLSLIFSLARIELLFPVMGETVVFVVDQSASMRNDDRAIDFIKDAIIAKDEHDRYGVIAVGGNAQIEQPITTRQELTALGTVINSNATSIADGIRLASSMIPSNSNGKIILLSDGLETSGDMLTEASFVRERGINIDVVSLQQEIGNEILVSSLKIPNMLNLDEEFQGTVEINSTTTAKGTLRFYEGNREIGSQTVNIEKGTNRFMFEQSASLEGFHKYRVELEAKNDNIKLNNQAYAFTQVSGKPKVLVVEGHQGAATNLVNALKAGNYEIDVRDFKLLPNELEDYKQFSTIVLADVQAIQIRDEDMERIRTSVRDMGLGLVMTGGNDSFGLGGWFKTPVEEALPVYMDVRGKEKQPSLGLMLVIDKSGSMMADESGFNKIELAKEAAIRATEMLNDKDQVGVVAFDGSPWLVVEPDYAKNLEEIQEKISGINADGGTDIYPAIVLAYEELKEVESQRKHVILMTDGQSGRNDDYQSLLDEMIDKNITVSTVAIGTGSDTVLLEQIASMGKGRYYFSNDPSSIPKIFSKETALASKTFIMNKPQVPTLVSSDEWSALRGGLPTIQSYIATTPKGTATVNLLSIDKDPILARWQYGLGRSVAWTSDLEGKWSTNWVTWNRFSQLWHQIINWTLPQINQGEWKTETQLNGNEGIITVDTLDGKLPQQMEAIIINEKMETTTVPLKAIAPKKLQASFEVDEEGTYMVQLVEKEGEDIIASQTEGLNVSYSPEYATLTTGESKLKELAMASKGKLISDPEDVFSDENTSGFEHQEISALLLILATILWPIDVGIRRINLPSTWLEQLKRRLRSNKDRGNGKKENSISGLVKKKTMNKRVPDNKASSLSNETYLIKKEKPSDNNKGRTSSAKQNTQSDTFEKLISAKNKNKK